MIIKQLDLDSILINRIFFIIKMKIFPVVLATIFTLTIHCLHINHHQSPETYLSLLKSQQKGITDVLSTLKSQYSQTQSKLNAETNLLNKIKILEQAILRQKSQLSTLSKTTLVPLNESDWTCQNFKALTQNQLVDLSRSIVNQTTSINNAVINLSNKTTTTFLTPDSNSALTAAQEIEKMASSTGTLQDTIQKQKTTNWLATNWISGNKTLQQIESQASSAANSTDFLTPCPIYTPFFDGTRCKACDLPLPYFNAETNQCVSCQIYDESTHKCKSSPPPTPLYNGTNFTQGLGQIIFPPNTNVQALKKQTSVACPSNLPFYTKDRGCIQCSGNTTLFNYQSQQCTTCGVNETYIPEKYACVGQATVTVTNLPTSNSRLILPDGVTVQSLQQEQQNLGKNSNVVPCPADKPFFNNQTCINCDNNAYFFNVQKLSCQNCSEGYDYNNVTHKCSKITYYSNLINGNWTSLNPKSIIDSQLASKQISGATPCPIKTPFYNGSNCIGCGQNQNYNFDAKVCQSCPQGTIFNLNLHSCIKSQEGLFQTNPNSTKLIYGGLPKNQWETQYNNNKIKYPTIQDCPVSTPYFDGTICINCSYENFPYFNLVDKQCANCDPALNQTYIQQKKQCQINETIVTQYPTIEKMLASIFT